MVGLRPPAIAEQYDASDPNAVKRAEAAAKLRLDQRRAVQTQLLATPEGREWLWQVMRDTGLFKDRTLTDSDYANGFSAGQLEVGLSVLRTLCRAAPEQFALLIKENDA